MGTMGTKRLETVGDCIKHELDLQAKCQHCSRAEVIDPGELMLELIKRRIRGQFDEVAKLMICKRCKRKQCRLIPVPRF